MLSGDTKYPPLTGTSQLKQVIRDKFIADNRLAYEPSEIIVSTGSKQAIYNAFMTTLDAGKAMSVIQFQCTSGASTISQAAAASAIGGDQRDRDLARAVYKRRRDKVVSWVASIPDLRLAPPGGAFYALVDCRDALPPIGFETDDDAGLTQRALQTAGVSFVPGSAFGAPGFIRLSFAASDADISEGLARISALLSARPR